MYTLVCLSLTIASCR